MGLSENSVPLHPMVLLIIIPTKWLFHWGYTPFSDIPICFQRKKSTRHRHGHVISLHLPLLGPQLGDRLDESLGNAIAIAAHQDLGSVAR